MVRPSDVSSTLAPMSSSACAIAASRSLSFTLNSASPLVRVWPCANAAATNKAGNSSIMLGARAGSTSTPVRGVERTRKSATGSPPTSRASTVSMAALISRSTEIKPDLVGLRPTFSIVRSLPSTSSAATMKKRRRRRIARNLDPLGLQVDLASQRDDPFARLLLYLEFGAEPAQHTFRMIARACRLDDRGYAGSVQPR